MTAGHKIHNVAKNTTLLSIAFAFQKFLSFFYFALIARTLGDTNLGKYTFALTFPSLFLIFMDFGLGPVLTRDGAKDEEHLEIYFRRVLALKFLFSAASFFALYVALAVYGVFRPLPYDTRLLTYIASGVVLLDTFTFTFYSVFRATQKLHFEAIGIVFYQILIVFAGGVAVYFHLPISSFVFAILLGSIFHFIYSLALVVWKARFSIRPLFDVADFRMILVASFPFAIANIFFKLNGSLDSIMLHAFAGERYLGWYSVASKLTTALTVLPGAFATSFFPAVSYRLIHDRGSVAKLFENSIVYLMAMSIPITAGVFILADRIVIEMFGPLFGASGEALRIFMAGLIFVFLNYPVGNFLNAAHLQARNTLNMGIALFVNVAFNFFLIPRYNFVGAAISSLVSSVVLLALGFPFVYKTIPFNIRFLLDKFVRILIAAVIMMLGVAFLEPFLTRGFELLFLVLFGAFLYAAALLFVKAFRPSDFRSFLSFFRKKKI